MSDLTDKSGHTMPREQGVEEAVQYILDYASKEEIRPFIEDYFVGATDAEILEWLVDPTTGDFADA